MLAQIADEVDEERGRISRMVFDRSLRRIGKGYQRQLLLRLALRVLKKAFYNSDIVQTTGLAVIAMLECDVQIGQFGAGWSSRL
jgi:hypothetical protein